MKKRLALTTALVGVTALSGCINVSNSLETPKYNVLEKSENFEIRQYNPYLVAEVTEKSNGEKSDDAAFMILADYIFGKNSVKKDIAMTAPVEIEQKSKKIAMTAPVEIENNSAEITMRFSIPSEFTLENLPKPNDNRIKIYKVAGYKAAVNKFTWNFTDERFAEKADELKEFIKNKNLKENSQPIKAHYNPPFTIPFLKRNEVIIKVK